MGEIRKLRIGEKAPTSTAYRLHHWEEAVGGLERIWNEDGLLKAFIGRIILILPTELENSLEPLQGSRISLLRTNIPGKEYLFRVLPDCEKRAPMNENARTPDSCEASA